MKNLFKKLSSIVLMGVMLMSMSAPAFATTNYTEKLTGQTTPNMDILLVMDNVYTLPSVELETNIELCDETFFDLPTVQGYKTPTGTPTITNVNFSEADSKTYEEANTYPGLTGKITNNQKFYVEDLEIDFSNVVFYIPGRYYYDLTVNSVISGKQIATNTKYYHVFVDVRNNNDLNGFEISNISVCEMNELHALLDQGKVSSILYNYEEFYDVDITNIISGNAAHLDDIFEYSIYIKSPKQGDHYTITVRPCFKNDKAMYYFNKMAIAAIWTNAKNETSRLS